MRELHAVSLVGGAARYLKKTLIISLNPHTQQQYTNLHNSDSQFRITESGTKIRNGPWVSLCLCKYISKDMDCMHMCIMEGVEEGAIVSINLYRIYRENYFTCSVFPKPISSPKMQPCPAASLSASHWTPFIWYWRRTTLLSPHPSKSAWEIRTGRLPLEIRQYLSTTSTNFSADIVSKCSAPPPRTAHAHWVTTLVTLGAISGKKLVRLVLISKLFGVLALHARREKGVSHLKETPRSLASTGLSCFEHDLILREACLLTFSRLVIWTVF